MLRYLEDSRERALLADRKAKSLVYLAGSFDVGRASGAEPLKGPRYSMEGQHLSRVENSGHPVVDEAAAPGLFVEIVAQAKQVFERRHGGKLLIILWWRDSSPAAVIDLFKKKGITAITLEEVIPDYRSNIQKYELADHHLSPESACGDRALSGAAALITVRDSRSPSALENANADLVDLHGGCAPAPSAQPRGAPPRFRRDSAPTLASLARRTHTSPPFSSPC